MLEAASCRGLTLLRGTVRLIRSTGGAGSRAGGLRLIMCPCSPWSQDPARDPAPPGRTGEPRCVAWSLKEDKDSSPGHSTAFSMEKGGRGRERERVSVLTSHSRAGHCNRPSNQLSTMLVVSPVIEEAAKLLLNHETKSMHYCNPPTATTPSSAWMEPESCICSYLKPQQSRFAQNDTQSLFPTVRS